MPNPFYQVYLGAAALSGAEPVFVSAVEQTNFLPDMAALDGDLLARTALAYYCSPANPQGAVAPLDTLIGLVEMAREYGFVVLFDECYSEIYGDEPPSGGMAACAALGGSLDNVLVFNSLSKRSSAPGLRSGFVAGDTARWSAGWRFAGAHRACLLLLTGQSAGRRCAARHADRAGGDGARIRFCRPV